MAYTGYYGGVQWNPAQQFSRNDYQGMPPSGFGQPAGNAQGGMQGSGVGINWVQGEAGAKAWYVMPGDGAGVPNLRTFEYSEVPAAESIRKEAALSRSEYEALTEKLRVISEEYNEIKAQHGELSEKLNGLINKRVKKGEDANE